MGKIKLLGTKKSEKCNYYVFAKEQKFFSIARKSLLDLEIDNYDANEFARPCDKKYGEPIMNEEDFIQDYYDKIFTFNNKKYFITIIFGKEKVFLIINTISDKQEEVSKILNKFVVY